MKRFLAFALAIMLIIPALAAIAYANQPASATRKAQLWWIIDAARGSGEFSYEFELAPSPAQIEAGTHGQRGIVEGKDGVVRAYHRNADGTYTEATNSVAMAIFARNFRLLTEMGSTATDPGLTVPAFFGEAVGSWTYENFRLITHAHLIASDADDRNITPTGDAVMSFLFDEGETGAMRGVHYFDPHGNGVFKKITNLQPALSGVTPDAFSPKTQLWWIIDAARGNGEFSFNFQLEDGTQGVVVGINGEITIVPHSDEVAAFTDNFALLTQRSHNHNNEVDGVRPIPPPFPEWLGLSEDFADANWNYELFPLVSPATLANAANPFEMNLRAERGANPDSPTIDERRGDMLFIYDGVQGSQIMSAVYWNGVYMMISNLQNTAVEIEETNDGNNTLFIALAVVAGAAVFGVIAFLLLKAKKSKV